MVGVGNGGGFGFGGRLLVAGGAAVDESFGGRFVG